MKDAKTTRNCDFQPFCVNLDMLLGNFHAIFTRAKLIFTVENNGRVPRLGFSVAKTRKSRANHDFCDKFLHFFTFSAHPCRVEFLCIVCATLNCPKKFWALRAKKKNHTPPRSFFLAGKRAKFFDKRNIAFFCVFQKNPFFRIFFTKSTFSYRKSGLIRK